MNEVWLTTAYFGPISYFKLIPVDGTVNMEACENYEKQSWRNRCRILAANGVMELSIPILKGRSRNQPIRDIRIDYHQNWQKLHYKSVESAYRHSPFYEFLIDDLSPFWTRKEEFLFDYNLKITEVILGLLQNPSRICLTEMFSEPGNYGEMDYRYRLHPKKNEGTGETPVPYHQVFSDRFGFVPDLSILDWIFNCIRT
jgi:hypothetical protein